MSDPRILLTKLGSSCTRRHRNRCPHREKWFYVHYGRYVLVVQYVPWRGYHLRSVRYASDPLNASLAQWSLPEISVKRIKMGEGAANSQAQHLAAIESKLLASLHPLVKFCCLTKYEDGTPRQVGWLTVQTRGAAWQCVLKDPDSGYKLVATANTVDDALALASVLLESEEAPWEVDPYLARQKGGKKKGS